MEPDDYVQGLPDESSSSIHPSDVTLSQGKHSVMSFFAKKDKEISSKQSSFGQVLESKEFKSEHDQSKSMSKASRMSKTHWKKGAEEREARLRIVVEENQKALAKLHAQMKREE